ncbi:MAG: hypothetical protein AAFU79_00345 [Myxococcota bacterium]
MVEFQSHPDRNPASTLPDPAHRPLGALDASARALAELCVDGESAEAWALLNGLMDQGADVDDVLFEVLPAAARKLQLDLSLDLATASEGTVAACQLRTFALRLHDRTPPERFVDRQAIFLEATGSTLDVEALLHVIALERAGWRVDALQGLEVRTALEPVRVAAPDVVLCSAHGVGGALRLAWAVRTMRWSAAPRPEGKGATRWLACGRGFHPGRAWPLDVVRSHTELMAACALAGR